MLYLTTVAGAPLCVSENISNFQVKIASRSKLYNVSPEEITDVAVMLASRAGGFIAGQNIIVDGGTVISDDG